MAENKTTAILPTPAELALLAQLRAQGEGSQPIRMDPGKAAAFDAWISQGGGVRKRGSRKGKFRSGPMKGMTMDEAREQFELKWESASPAIKAKYQRRATDSPAPLTGNAALNTPKPGESRQDFEKRTMGGTAAATTVQKPYDKDSNGVPDMIQRPRQTTTKAPSDPVAIGTPEEQAKVRAMVGEGEGFATAGTGDAGMKAAVGMEAAKKDYEFGFDFPKDMEALGNAIHGRGFKPNERPVAPASTTTTPATPTASVDTNFVGPPAPITPVSTPAGTFSNAKRRGGASPSGIAGRASTGASPSAPPAVRNEVAASAGVPPIMPGQVAAAQVPQATPATTATRINPLTGLPFGAMPGQTAGLNPAQAANADRMAVERAGQGTPVSRPGDLAGADNALRSQGMVVRTPVRPAPVQPPKPAGYQPRSPLEDTRMAAEAAAARRSGTMGDYFTAQGNTEMAKSFPNRTSDPVVTPQRTASTTIQNPFQRGPVARPQVTAARRPPAFAIARR